MAKYSIRTDLACESEAVHDAGKNGTAYTEEERDGFRVAKLTVQNEVGERATGKRRGTYVTIFSALLCDEGEERLDALFEKPRLLCCQLLAGRRLQGHVGNGGLILRQITNKST